MCKSTWSEYTAHTVLDSCHDSRICLWAHQVHEEVHLLVQQPHCLLSGPVQMSSNVHLYHGHHLEDETLLYVKTVMNMERHKWWWCCVQAHGAYLIKRTAVNAHTTCSQTIFLQIVQSVATNPVIQYDFYH